MLNLMHAIQRVAAFFATFRHESARKPAAIETGMLVKKKNHAPAARTLGRNGFVPTKPNWEWWRETARKPLAYRAMAIPATALENVSAHGAAELKNSRLDWGCCVSELD